MEFGTREILIVLGIVIILGVLLDGLRRVRQASSGSLKTARRKQAIFDDDPDDLLTELPSGEVRVTHRDEQSVEQVSDSIKRRHEQQAGKCTSAFLNREQSRDLGDEDESVEEAAEPLHDQSQTPLQEPVLDATNSLREFAIDDDEGGAETQLEPEFHQRPGENSLNEERIEPHFGATHQGDSPREPSPSLKAAENENPRDAGGSANLAGDGGDVIVLHIMAKKGKVIEGSKLLNCLLANHLRFGTMQIFHRHQHRDGSGPVLFSLANSLKPGTFDLENMGDFSTPGVTLFMTLAGLPKPLEAFGELVRSAQNVAKTLDGELKDETRSALTKQTIEHYRQQVIEYTRRCFTLTN